ncbi:MAG: hypothetical protein M3R24_34490 [Chloroflexota bacterium]|nr:hypothetical protein [Chloroflexota bacterium]
MERIEPSVFSGPRAYFTNFDPQIVSRTSGDELQQQEVERVLKILLLTKSTVVCAASHLTSDFAYAFFRSHPILLNKGLVIPAMRRDKLEVADLFVGKAVPRDQLTNRIHFYEDELSTVVNWDFRDNTQWFWDNFTKELVTENSVLRRNLIDVPNGQIAAMVDAIKHNPVTTIEKIHIITEDLNPQHRQPLIDFGQLLYHMSGARVVQCQSTLPQENYLDYSLADIENRQIVLSEAQIFWKIFLELALDAMRRPMIPVELLDHLSFEDVYHLRKPIAESSFREKYDDVIVKAVSAAVQNDAQKILFNLEELMRIQADISEAFEAMLDQELGRFGGHQRIKDAKNLAKSTFSFGINLAGLFGPLASLSTGIGITLAAPPFLFNLFQMVKHWQAVDQYQVVLNEKERIVKKTIESSDIGDKTALLDAVSILKNTIGEKIKS